MAIWIIVITFGLHRTVRDTILSRPGFIFGDGLEGRFILDYSLCTDSLILLNIFIYELTTHYPIFRDLL